MSVTITAKPVPERASLSDGIAATLRDEILRGQYRPGERLPSERDLALRFSTGRGPVREALKKLEQLGIASIQHGGARVVAIEECTLDVLGPLLDLDEVPDAALIDQVLQMVGQLVRVAADTAVRKATPEQLSEIKLRAAELVADYANDTDRHKALQALTVLFVKVSDHLVLRLMMNGLRTSFMTRMTRMGIHYDLDSESYRDIAMELRGALDDRDSEGVGKAMQKLNLFLRDSVRRALVARRDTRTNP